MGPIPHVGTPRRGSVRVARPPAAVADVQWTCRSKRRGTDSTPRSTRDNGFQGLPTAARASASSRRSAWLARRACRAPAPGETRVERQLSLPCRVGGRDAAPRRAERGQDAHADRPDHLLERQAPEIPWPSEAGKPADEVRGAPRSCLDLAGVGAVGDDREEVPGMGGSGERCSSRRPRLPNRTG